MDILLTLTYKCLFKNGIFKKKIKNKNLILVGRVFANGLGDQSSFPGHVMHSILVILLKSSIFMMTTTNYLIL